MSLLSRYSRYGSSMIRSLSRGTNRSPCLLGRRTDYRFQGYQCTSTVFHDNDSIRLFSTRHCTTSSTTGGSPSKTKSADVEKKSKTNIDETDETLAAVLKDVKKRVMELQKMGIDLAGLKGVKMPGPKMVLKFTCDYHGPKGNSENGCGHVSTKVISKKSYETGVVLVRCDKCDNLHLIADNKGFFDDDKINIETIMKEKGQAVKRMLVEDTLDVA
eukprot:GSMAST32.ASY1.ANO1.2337.1 assembled CDS